VLGIIPGNGVGSSMIFARRQVSSLQLCGIEVRTLMLPQRRGWGLVQAARELRRAVRDFQPHLLHAHYGTVTSLLCAAVTSRPLVITFRGSDLNRDPAVGWWRFAVSHLMSQLSTLRARRVICVSEELRRKLWFGSADVVPTGVDLARFWPRDRQACRAELGWREETPVVLFCSGGAPQAKGVALVEAAVTAAARHIEGLRLVVLDGAVPPDDVASYLNAADCLAFASESEGSPNIIKEALACNLPIVSVDVGDVRERLRGVSPSCIVTRDVFSFSEALVSVLRLKQRSNGRSQAMTVSQDATAAAIVQIYEQAVGRSHGRMRSRRVAAQHEATQKMNVWTGVSE
jgi:glycosyltransferase involved in cell wall biosynthesis